MVKQSNLSFFERLVFNNGVSSIEAEFHNIIGRSNNLDSSKNYDEINKVYYLFRHIHDPEGYGTIDITNESYPHSFSEYLSSTLWSNLHVYKNWFNQQIETRNVEQILRDHKNRVSRLNAHHISNEVVRNTIIELNAFINDKLKALITEVNLNDLFVLVEEFAHEFSKKTKYDVKHISSYLKEFVKLDGHSNKRARVSNVFDSLEITKPSDAVLSNWENKWSNFRASRTRI